MRQWWSWRFLLSPISPCRKTKREKTRVDGCWWKWWQLMAILTTNEVENRNSERSNATFPLPKCKVGFEVPYCRDWTVWPWALEITYIWDFLVVSKRLFRSFCRRVGQLVCQSSTGRKLLLEVVVECSSSSSSSCRSSSSSSTNSRSSSSSSSSRPTNEPTNRRPVRNILCYELYKLSNHEKCNSTTLS